MNKAVTCCALIFLSATTALTAGTDQTVISSYDPHSDLVYYNDESITAYAGRFEIPAPCTIEAVRVRLTGGISDKAAVLYIYGHEGGASTPSFEHLLHDPLILAKEQVGFQEIVVPLPQPVNVANNQVFIVLRDVDSLVKVVSDSKIQEPSCSDVSGDTFMMQYVQDRSGMWKYGLFAFGIDLDVVYHDAPNSAKTLTDVTTAVGFPDSLHYRTVAWADINHDGWADVLVGGKLYLNREGVFQDITDNSGMAPNSLFGFFIDVDNDSFSDIVVVPGIQDAIANGSITIHMNNRNGGFLSGRTLPFPFIAPTCFSVADINNDRYPDVFIGQGKDSTGIIQPDILLVNDGNQSFVSHMVATETKTSPTVGCTWVDYNNDNRLDLYLTKYNGRNDELWHNNGDGTFTNVFDARIGKYNAERYGYKTGCDWGDIDNDGDMDILQPQQINAAIVKQYGESGTTVLQNSGEPAYTFRTIGRTKTGLALEEAHAGGTLVDVDNDGLLDIFLTTSCKCRYADLYMQQKDHSFTLESFRYGLHTTAAGIDAAWVDFNNDGTLDLATGVDGVFRLFSNQGIYGNNVVKVDLHGNASNRQAIGATVTLHAGNQHYTRQVVSGRGYGMQPPLQLHFGIGENTHVDSAVVVWSNGNREVVPAVEVNTVTVIQEKEKGTAGFADAPSVRAYPNPFNSETTIDYEVTRTDRVRLEIYTLLGEHIRVLVNEQQIPGRYRIKWNGTNDQDMKLSGGTYLYKLSVGDRQQSGHVTFHE